MVADPTGCVADSCGPKLLLKCGWLREFGRLSRVSAPASSSRVASEFGIGSGSGLTGADLDEALGAPKDMAQSRWPWACRSV
jgi:hypothetical protein